MSNNLTPLESPKLPLFPLQWSLKLVRQCKVPSSEHWLLVFELPCHNIKCLSTAAIATHDPPFPSSLLAPSLLPSTAVDLAPTLPAVGVNVWRDVHRFRLCRRGEDADDLPMRQWFGAMGVEQPPTITHACFVFVLFLPRLPHYHPMNLCTLPHLQLSTPSSLSPGAPPYHPIHPTKHAMHAPISYTLLEAWNSLELSSPPGDMDSKGSSNRMYSYQPPTLTTPHQHKSNKSSSHSGVSDSRRKTCGLLTDVTPPYYQFVIDLVGDQICCPQACNHITNLFLFLSTWPDEPTECNILPSTQTHTLYLVRYRLQPWASPLGEHHLSLLLITPYMAILS